jgi:hypothetical protein
MEDYGFSLEQHEIGEEYWGKDWNNPVIGDASEDLTSEEHASKENEIDDTFWHHGVANYQSAWDYSSPKPWLGVP